MKEIPDLIPLHDSRPGRRSLVPVEVRAVTGSPAGRSRFNTSVTQMVQNIGNTWQAWQLEIGCEHALEKDRTYEPEERVCDASVGNG